MHCAPLRTTRSTERQSSRSENRMHNGEFVVHPGRPVKLAELDPGFTADFKSKADADERLQNDIARLVELQDVFAAARSHALLIIFQGMDSAGKDGVIKHVMSGVNP